MPQAQDTTERCWHVSRLHAAGLYVCAAMFALLCISPPSVMAPGNGDHASFRKAIPAVDHTLRDENIARTARPSADEQTGACPSPSSPHLALTASVWALSGSVRPIAGSYAGPAAPWHGLRSAHRPRAPPCTHA